ncbi:MAG TPA: high-affinity nickel-transport family protein [Polyangiaceae bacterium]|nr:high-affinity nickel-transport family protein [Polyangiaceae bacterium]
MSLLSVLALGLFLGMRHATDADHVVAMTTLVTRQRNTRAAALLGALWGAGHGLTLLVVGGAIILLGVAVPPRLGLALELGVGLMLIALGVINLRSTTRHLRHAHDHAVAHPAAVDGAPARGFRSFVIGVVHGLAGSAAIALLVLSTIRDTGWAFLYLGFFGVGTVAGMMLLTMLLSVPLAAATRRFGGGEGNVERWLGSVTGALSVAFGLFLVYQIGFVDGLFGAAPTWDPH